MPTAPQSPFDDPKVETIASLVKRRHGMAVGIVTNTEIEDATPAAMIAHTRRRATYDQIVEQFYAAKPDVLMGGGSANFLPKGAPGARRKDDADYIAEIPRRRLRRAPRPRPEMTAAAKARHNQAARPVPHRQHGRRARPQIPQGRHGEEISRPARPDRAGRRPRSTCCRAIRKGFFLMVESGMIDKYTHALDMERAVYDTIMLDNAVKLARDWAAARGDDTLILVLADHNHPISLIGTIDDDMTATPNAPLRERVGTYDKAGFPNYPAPDKDGYPTRVDVSRRLAIFSASSPGLLRDVPARSSTTRTIRPSPARSRAPSRPTSATATRPARCCGSATCRNISTPACIPART